MNPRSFMIYGDILARLRQASGLVDWNSGISWRCISALYMYIMFDVGVIFLC